MSYDARVTRSVRISAHFYYSKGRRHEESVHLHLALSLDEDERYVAFYAPAITNGLRQVLQLLASATFSFNSEEYTLTIKGESGTVSYQIIRYGMPPQSQIDILEQEFRNYANCVIRQKITPSKDGSLLGEREYKKAGLYLRYNTIYKIHWWGIDRPGPVAWIELTIPCTEVPKAEKQAFREELRQRFADLLQDYLAGSNVSTLDYRKDSLHAEAKILYSKPFSKREVTELMYGLDALLNREIPQ